MVDITALPASPTMGQQATTENGWSYTWDGSRWGSNGFVGIPDPLADFTLFRSSATDPTTTSTAISDNGDASIWCSNFTRSGQPTPTDAYDGVPDSEVGCWGVRQDFNSSGTLISGQLMIAASRSNDQSWANGTSTTRNTSGDTRHFSAYNFFAGDTDVTTTSATARDWTFSSRSSAGTFPARYMFFNSNVGVANADAATADRWLFTLSDTFSIPSSTYDTDFAGHTFDVRRGEMLLDGYWTGNGFGTATAPTGAAYTRYTIYELYVLRTAP